MLEISVDRIRKQISKVFYIFIILDLIILFRNIDQILKMAATKRIVKNNRNLLLNNLKQLIVETVNANVQSKCL